MECVIVDLVTMFKEVWTYVYDKLQEYIWAMLRIWEHLIFIIIILNLKKAIGVIKIILSHKCDRKLVNFHKEIILVKKSH